MVEILVSASIFLTAVVGFVAAFDAFTSLSRHTAEKTAAALLLEEGMEALQLLRDQGWTEHIAPLTPGQEYTLYWSGSAYAATSTEMTIGESYTRSITLSTVRRNGSDTVDDSGTLDDDTRAVTIEVARQSDGEVLATAAVLIHNIYEAD